MKILAKSRTISLIVGLILLTFILPGAVSAYPTSSLNAQVISTTIPSSMHAGQSYPVTVTMKNTGQQTWNEASRIRLGALTDNGDAGKFGPAYSKIPAGINVLPGAQYTFTFTMTAPSDPGNYTPKYRMVRDRHEWFGSRVTRTIRVASPAAAVPVAQFTASAVSGLTPLGVQFTDKSVSQGTTSYAWDMNNDGVVEYTTQNPSHTYQAAGNYTVKLTVKNAAGSDSEIKTSYIRVTSPVIKPTVTPTVAVLPPAAQFISSVTQGTSPLTVQFNDQSAGTTPMSYAWDFNNDRNIDSTIKSPSYIYTTAGTYTINLTVTNSAGKDSEIKTGYIRVSSAAPQPTPTPAPTTALPKPPAAQFTVDSVAGISPLRVQFTDQSIATGTTTYAWDVNNDGTTDYTTKSPSHSYTTAGTYSVKLTVSNASGSDSEIKTDYIRVSSSGISSVPSSAIYLTDFGIKGDGSDESAKLKSALSYAASHSIKAVVFPAGKTIGVNTVIETPENLEYIGNGCTIKLVNNAAVSHDGCFIYFHAGSYVHNLVIDGNSANQGGSATNGVMLYTNDRFEDNEVKNVGAYTIYTYKGDNILINNNTIHDTWQYGIGTSGEGFPTVNDYSNNITITNNKIYNCGQVGIKIRQTSNSLVKGNIITVPTSRYDDAPAGIRLYSFDGANNHITVTENQISAPGDGSIAISSDDSANSYISITNNKITNANTGIKINFNNGVITGNTITYRSTCIANKGSGNTVSGNSCN